MCDKTVEGLFLPHLFFSSIYISNSPMVIWLIRTLYRINKVIKFFFKIRPVFNLLTDVGENERGEYVPLNRKPVWSWANYFKFNFALKVLLVYYIVLVLVIKIGTCIHLVPVNKQSQSVTPLNSVYTSNISEHPHPPSFHFWEINWSVFTCPSSTFPMAWRPR